MQLLYIHATLQWEWNPGEVKTGGKGWDWWYVRKSTARHIMQSYTSTIQLGPNSTCLDDGNLSRNIHTWILNMLAVQIWGGKDFINPLLQYTWHQNSMVKWAMYITGKSKWKTDIIYPQCNGHNNLSLYFMHCHQGFTLNSSHYMQ